MCMKCSINVHFSRLVVSDSLWPHGLQHTRLPCLLPTPGACSNSCPSSWGCLFLLLCTLEFLKEEMMVIDDDHWWWSVDDLFSFPHLFNTVLGAMADAVGHIKIKETLFLSSGYLHTSRRCCKRRFQIQLWRFFLYRTVHIIKKNRRAVGTLRVTENDFLVEGKCNLNARWYSYLFCF